jgi:hypothetical protein
MTWFPKHLDWSRKVRALPACPHLLSPQAPHSVPFPPQDNGKGLQMPLGIPIATGVLALLALLALACHCIKEVLPPAPAPLPQAPCSPSSLLMTLSASRPGSPSGSLAGGAGGALALICSLSPYTAHMRDIWEPLLQSPVPPGCFPQCAPEDSSEGPSAWR